MKKRMSGAIMVLLLLVAAIVGGFSARLIALAAPVSDGHPVTVTVPESGVRIGDVFVNNQAPVADGDNAGWFVTRNENNILSFHYVAPAGTVFTLTDSSGRILGTWTVGEDVFNGDFSEAFALFDGVGDYVLTLTATVGGEEVATTEIPVRWLGLDGGGPGDGGDGSGEVGPGVPGTGSRRYVYLGGYAVPSYWLILFGVIIVAFTIFVVARRRMKLAGKAFGDVRKNRKV